MAVRGAKAHAARLKRMTSPKMVREVGKAVFVAADFLATEAALSITAGAVSGKGHVASAPGEAPNADTHELDRSIRAEKTGPLTAEASANAAHAVPLELGTSRVAARPVMRPAAVKTRPRAEALVAEAVKRVVKGQTL